MIIKPEKLPEDWKFITRVHMPDSEIFKNIFLSKKENNVIISECWWFPDDKKFKETFYIAGFLEKEIAGCNQCNNYPELRQDAKTGKFYCTCPSSFFSDDQEIGDNNYEYGISPNVKLFDTMTEALDNWNNTMNYQILLSEIKKLIKKSKTFKIFSQEFDSLIKANYYSPSRRLEIILKIMSCKPSSYPDGLYCNQCDKNYEKAEKTVNKIIFNLKKLLFLNLKENE